LVLAWGWGDDWHRSQAWFINRWFQALPPALKFAIRHGHWLFYLGYALLLVAGWRKGNKRYVQAVLIYLAAQLVFALALVQVLKIALGRPRPYLEFQAPADWRPLSFDTQHQAMPSGHSADAMVGASVLIRFFASPWLRAAGLALALLVAASRVLQSQHYPSDVIAGCLIGYLGGTCLAWWWTRRFGAVPEDKQE